ncbi:hypothetical protein VIGAN_08301200 [Vigna angularis var. angularis]|uniref:Uncharacterized protein n=1 Tax=Vigna angularis var. angularis TaxID=157739 RepID=A0A0S3STJ3_PHAAN|nr:hypothetical protein VIGAN_08301200 [Vigna angularis var. angularis]
MVEVIFQNLFILSSVMNLNVAICCMINILWKKIFCLINKTYLNWQPRKWKLCSMSCIFFKWNRQGNVSS